MGVFATLVSTHLKNVQAVVVGAVLAMNTVAGAPKRRMLTGEPVLCVKSQPQKTSAGPALGLLVKRNIKLSRPDKQDANDGRTRKANRSVPVEEKIVKAQRKEVIFVVNAIKPWGTTFFGVNESVWKKLNFFSKK